MILAQVVARTRAGGFRTDVRSGRHALIVDEPRSVGGSNLGPTPYDLLSAALAGDDAARNGQRGLMATDLLRPLRRLLNP